MAVSTSMIATIAIIHQFFGPDGAAVTSSGKVMGSDIHSSSTPHYDPPATSHTDSLHPSMVIDCINHYLHDHR